MWKAFFLMSIIVLATIIGVSNCKKKSITQKNMDVRKQQEYEFMKLVFKRLVYAKDERTGLCFVYCWYLQDANTYYAYSGMGITHVPCTKLVLKAINQEEK